MKKRKKKLLSVLAVTAVTAVCLISGTFAWNATQTAKNEKNEDLNPGGRLHDDFDGKNKDVYVENYTDPDNGGMTVYARIRLYEYLEIGEKAGTSDGTSGKKAKSVVEGAKIGDTSTWYLHNPYGTDEVFHDYFTWEEGGSTSYMPTFNKDNTSLLADINGTLAGTGAGVAYDDYVDYSDPSNTSKTAYEILSGGTQSPEEVTHEVQTTLGAQVITMSEWKAQGREKGEFWVYDTDGWAYWASGIEPGTATGCLLTGIKRSPKLGDEYYYGINVVTQIATAGEWGRDTDGNGYFTKGEEATNDALYLLGIASDETKKVKITNKTNKTEVDRGEVITFKGQVLFGSSVLDEEKVTWSIMDNESESTVINSNGILTVGEDETSNTLAIKAVSSSDPELYALYVVHVNVPDTYGIEVTTNDTITKRSKIVVVGRTKQFLAEVSKNGVVDKDTPVVWTVEGGTDGTVVTNSGELQVAANETAETLTVKATCNVDATAFGTYEIEVISEMEYIPYVVGTEETVTIDGIEWYVLTQKLDQYLLWSASELKDGEKYFDGSNSGVTWKDSSLRIWLNGNSSSQFLKQIPTLSPKIVTAQGLTTRSVLDPAEWATTDDKVFLLSEADIFGTTGGTTAQDKDYTCGYKTSFVTENMIKSKNPTSTATTGSGNTYWLRSTYNSKQQIAMVHCVLGTLKYKFSNNFGYVRPALWVNINQ